MSCEQYEEMEKLGECSEAGKCKEDGCGLKKKKKADSISRVNRVDVYDDDWNFSFRETPEGYLMGKAVVTNVGVFTYLNTDGTVRRELRLPEEVFRPDSMWSLRGKPVTNNHPTEKVTVENIHDYAVGKTEGEPIFDSYYLSIGLVFDDKETIQQIKNGKRALSCGYDCELEWTPGVWMGVPYDAIQRNIVYNHISLVDRGRAGDAAVIRIDTVDAIVHKSMEVNQMDANLRTISLDSVDYKADEKVIEAYQAAIANATEIQKNLDAAIAEKSTAIAEKDAVAEKLATLQKNFDELQANHVDKSELDRLVQDRIDLYDVAKKAGVEYKNTDADMDIKKAVIAKLAPKAQLDNADDTYINTRFRIVVEDMDELTADAAAQAARIVNAPQNTEPEKRVDAEASRQAMKERLLGKKKD
jgi:hypothetical protein